MDLSPNKFPRKRAVTAAAAHLRHSRCDLETEEQNVTPMRQELPFSNNTYVSPKPPPAHNFTRTHSSPSIIDTSPKQRTKMKKEPSPNCVVGADFARTQTPKAQHRFIAANLTPVTSNMGMEASHPRSNNAAYKNSGLEEISVPDAHSLKSSLFRNVKETSENSRNQVIHPRHDDTAEHEPIQFQPNSPNAWLHRFSSDPDQSSAPYPEHRHSSPLASVQLNRQSLIASPPESMVPYQPARDVRLGSFGIVRNDAESIFHNSMGSQQGGQQTSEYHNADHTDISIPSIHLATELDSSTMGSLTTISADDIDSLMEDSSVFTENLNPDVRQWGCFPNLSMVKALVAPQKLLNSAPPVDNIKKKAHTARTSTQNSSRYMSPEKEREVFDWLHSLEVDKDNNDYVLEAASSKFLSGKINMEDEYIILEESLPELRSNISYPTDTKLRSNTNGSKFSRATARAKNAVVPPAASAPRRVKTVAAGQGSVAEYCGKERRLIVQSQCKRRKKRPILRSCSGM